MSDYHEIFDGVPSQHDGKDAAMVAELVAHGKGTLWPFATLSEHEQILRHQVFRIDAFRKQQTQWLGRTEALTARHWPELTSVLKLTSVTLRNLLATSGSPAKAIGDPVAYSSAGAYLKAFGLNLKERSSGKRLGQLAISKRDPAMSRRWLIAMMRKLCKSLWHARVHNKLFDYSLVISGMALCPMCYGRLVQ